MTVASSAMIGGTGAHKRHASDFYQTPPEATIALLRRHSWLIAGKVWEPACGEGAISKVILQCPGAHTYCTDIRPTGYTSSGVDYLTAPPPGPHTVITNPPFNLAEEFIRKACSEAEGVAMLLKATFWNAKSRLALFNETKPSFVHPLTWRPAMAPDRGKSPTMDFCWTVWAKQRKQEAPFPCIFEPLAKP